MQFSFVFAAALATFSALSSADISFVVPPPAGGTPEPGKNPIYRAGDKWQIKWTGITDTSHLISVTIVPVGLNSKGDIEAIFDETEFVCGNYLPTYFRSPSI